MFFNIFRLRQSTISQIEDVDVENFGSLTRCMSQSSILCGLCGISHPLNVDYHPARQKNMHTVVGWL